MTCSYDQHKFSFGEHTRLISLPLCMQHKDQAPCHPRTSQDRDPGPVAALCSAWRITHLVFEKDSATQTSNNVYLPRVFRCGYPKTYVVRPFRPWWIHMAGKQRCPSPRGARSFTPVKQMGLRVLRPRFFLRLSGTSRLPSVLSRPLNIFHLRCSHVRNILFTSMSISTLEIVKRK